MAAICLRISSTLKDTFQAAQNQTSSVRSLSISIVDEAYTFSTKTSASSNVGADFEALSGTLEEAQPQFIVFCVDDADAKNNGAAAAATATSKQWLLVCYVPDLSKPREKMLYSSSRDALKRELGSGLFRKGDFYCNELKDFSWQAYQTVGSVLRDTLVSPSPLLPMIR